MHVPWELNIAWSLILPLSDKTENNSIAITQLLNKQSTKPTKRFYTRHKENSKVESLHKISNNVWASYLVLQFKLDA